MSAKELARLIASYRWLTREHEIQVVAAAEANARHIHDAMNAVFMQIVRFSTDEPEIICFQLEFIVKTLAEDRHEAPVRSLLCDAALAHVKQLAGHVPRRQAPSRPR